MEVTLRVWFWRAWKDPVWSKVIATGIAAGVAVLVASEWREVIGFLGPAWVATSGFLTQGLLLPLWLVCLLVLASVCLLLLLLILFIAARHKAPSGPDYQAYVTDEFAGLRWRWHYPFGRISDPAPFCPRCDTELRLPPGSAMAFVAGVTFSCDGCGNFDESFDRSYEGLQDWVVRSIQRNLRNGSWVDRVGRP